MSGTVGLLNLDGSPVDRVLLNRMLAALAFRGPDAQQSWADGPVGLGHAMFRTTREAEHEQQPATLNGNFWITADARLDAPAELIENLESKGRSPLKRATDSELILHAYDIWGEACVDHLLGDFAFAIWNAKQRQLFCARDHFGVKPFFYALAGNCLVFTNTLSCIRLHPGVSNTLNDLAIADFLLMGSNQEPTSTSFADIYRLPAAHTLSISEGNLRVQRYWTLPIDETIRYKREGDYIEQFQELLRVVVADRLSTDRVSVFMSGGLDSSIVAAAANEWVTKHSNSVKLRAHTIVYDRLVPDQERHYSTLVAEALGIPIQHLAADNYSLYERADDPSTNSQEPLDSCLRALATDSYRDVAAQSRVALTGEGGDPGLGMSMSSHIWREMRNSKLSRVARDFVRYLIVPGRISRLYVRKRVGILIGENRRQDLYPRWLNPDFETSWNLRTRWHLINTSHASGHPARPEAYGMLASSFWPFVFESYDPGVTGALVEVRHPIFDVRLIRFLLALPALPWCADKMLFREAATGILPERVRLRRKVPLDGDPVGELLKQPESQWIDNFKSNDSLARYVDRNRIPLVVGEKDYQQRWLNLRPISLNFWLQSQGGAGITR